MYKLLIVDDEIEIRNGLRYLDWNSICLNPVAECEHGLEACQWLESNAVDLVLTDIRMPVMNGLELSEHISKRYPHIKTIVLSGYNDFELARESMRHGTLDYLLKPVNPDELLKVAATAVECIRQEGARRDTQKKLEWKVRQSIKLLRQQFLYSLLFQVVDSDELQEGCTASELLLDERYCSVGAMRLDLKEDWNQAYSDKDRKLILFAFDNVLTELWDDAGHGYHYIDYSQGNIFLIMAREPSETKDLRVLMEQLKQSMKKFRGLFRTTLSIAFGTERPSHQLSQSCREALTALEQADKDALASYDGSSPLLTPFPLIKTTSKEIVPEQHHEGSKGKTANYLVNAAQDYVSQHYVRPLSLQEVAQHVHINSSYLSHLFKEVTGNTFVHYLTTCRINQAKDLLVDPQYKVYEVGHIVGYDNPRYFAETFKKYTGKTPYEFRSQ